MKEQSAKGARAMHEVKRERKAAELERACRKSGLSPEAYAKAKQTVKRLKGSNDWLPQLDANDLSALDAMMNDWRSSGLDYFSWRDKDRKEREREASDRREAWRKKHNKSPEAKDAERRERDAERKRSARSAATEKSKIDVISLKTLTPPHVRLSPERDACHGSGSKRRTAAPEPVPGHKQAFKIGMAVVKWRDGDAEDAKARVLPPTFAAELAALTLELTPEERVRLFSIKRTGSQDEAQDENPRISLLDTKSLAEFDHLNPREKPNRQTSNQATPPHVRLSAERDACLGSASERRTATPAASRDRNSQQILERIERELAGTATLEAVKSLLSHLDSKGISNVRLLNDLERQIKESQRQDKNGDAPTGATKGERDVRG